MAKDKICTPFLSLVSPENKFTVSTIEDMQSRKYLKIGDVVELNGYYTAGDGAGHKRKIEAADDGSGVQLANGLWANIVHNGEVNVSWFGAKGDGVTDDTVAIQKALEMKSINNYVFDSKEYLCSELIINRPEVKLQGSNTEYRSSIKAKQGTDTLITSKNYSLYMSSINISGYNYGSSQLQQTNLIRIDRTLDGDESETTGNLDAVFINCGFVYAKKIISFKGRNVKFEDCIFSNSKKAIVGVNHTNSDCRGIEVKNCRFHSIGMVSSGIPSDTYFNEVVCIELGSAYFGNMIVDNYIDSVSYNFFKGSISDTVIDGNLFTNEFRGGFVYGISDTINKNSKAIITNNTIQGVGSSQVTDIKLSGIYLDFTSTFTDVIISNNNIFNTHNNSLTTNRCTRLNITNNYIYNNGGEIGINVVSSNYADINTNTIFGGANTTDAIKVDATSRNVSVFKNRISDGINKINIGSQSGISNNNIGVGTSWVDEFYKPNLTSDIYNGVYSSMNTNGDKKEYYGIEVTALSKSSGAEKVQVDFKGLVNGIYQSFMKFDGATGRVVFNVATSLDTPYHATQMSKLGILDSYHDYLTELHEYEKQQNTQSDTGVMNLNVIQPPIIPTKVEEYAKEYNLI